MSAAHQRNVLVVLLLVIASAATADTGILFAHADPLLVWAANCAVVGVLFIWLAKVVPTDPVLGKMLQEQFYYLWRDRRYWPTVGIVFCCGAAVLVLLKVA